MKKNLLVVLCLFLLSNAAFSAETKGQAMESEIKQKACQNVFSLINIDLSFMSPRAAVADVIAPNSPCPMCKKDAVMPIANKKEAMPQPAPSAKCSLPEPPASPTKPKNRTSFFRIDLLGMFKIQIL